MLKGKKNIVSVDRDTGEILEGIPVVLQNKKTGFNRLYGKGGWYIMATNACTEIAKDKELTGETQRILFYMFGCLDYENYINVSQAEIAEELEIRKQHVNRAVRLLEAKQIIMRGPKSGRSITWRLNPNYGYKGAAKNVRNDGGHLRLVK